MKQRFQSGLSMIEVLVTMVLIAVGSLALAGMQLAAVKYNKEASFRSVATLLAVEISDRMRSNIAGVKASSYDRNLDYAAATAAIAAPDCGSHTDCTAAALAQLDIHNWQTSLATALPGGAGAIIPSTATKYASSIVVMWKDKSLSDEGKPDPACKTAPVVGIRCFSTMFMP
jgi:type IV pilus assembly protein PilV